LRAQKISCYKKQELQKQKSIKTGFSEKKKVMIKTEKRRISTHPTQNMTNLTIVSPVKMEYG
jgi:hypothetical protein